MHPCLWIDEIVREICSCLGRSELLSVALTCRQFKEPALSTLWRSLEHLNPLVELFPPDTWQTTAIHHKEGDIQHGILDRMEHIRHWVDPKRPVRPSDWLIAASYTPYVRILHFSGARNPVHVDFLDSAVDALDGSQIIFPNLRNLRVTNYLDGYFPFIKSLLSPCLTHLTLELKHGKTILGLLSRLGTTCPLIVSFRCMYEGMKHKKRAALKECLSQGIIGWTALKELYVPFLATEAVNYLSELIHLESLTIHEVPPSLHLTEPDYRTDVQDPKHISMLRSTKSGFSTGFNTLRSLEVGCSLTRLIELMRSLQTSCLERIEVDFPNDEMQTAFQWANFFSLLSESSSLAEELSLVTSKMVNAPIPSNTNTFLVKAEALRPLLTARNLRALQLSDCYYFDLNDYFIDDLARASPQLEIMEISNQFRTDRLPTLTLNAYTPLFKHCPKLKYLGLVVDTSSSHQYLHKISNEHEIKRLNHQFLLHVGGSEVENPTDVGTFLPTFFEEPLVSMSVASDAEDHVKQAWLEVNIQFRAIIFARQKRNLESSASVE